MTGYDWSEADACCMNQSSLDETLYVCPAGCDAVVDCVVNCDAFYYSRMPRKYELVDIFICLIYLVKYIILIFIAQSRYTFFISNDSIKQMFMIFPVLFYSYECN